jgi:lysophospholipase L1-like esterase
LPCFHDVVLVVVITIVALGDSTTAGTPGFKSPLEAPPNGSGNVESQYAYWLARAHSDWQVLNRGVDGQRSDQIRARFARDTVQAAPDVAVIIAGVNDIYQGRAAAAVERELEAIYTAARPTPEQNACMRAVNDWIRGYVAQHDANMVFCDARAAVAAPGQPDRLLSSPDDLHPSPDGYKLMAAALDPAIVAALAKARWLR